MMVTGQVDRFGWGPACCLVMVGLPDEAGRVPSPVLLWLRILLAALAGACLYLDLPGGFWRRGVTARLAGTSVA